jgi:hypothetical protein
MPSVSPAASPPLPRVSPVPIVQALPPGPGVIWPTLGPSYPKAGPVGVLVIALAYFSLGVAVGALMKQAPRARRWLPFIVIPGVLAGLAFFAWVVRSLL